MNPEYIQSGGPVGEPSLSNSDIADRLAALAQLLSLQKENGYKIKAYQRAAAKIRAMGESVDDLVREETDLTQFPGIGDAIAAAIREIVLTGSLKKLEALRAQVSPEIAHLTEYPRLDPKLIRRAYKKLNISSIDELRHMLDSGELEKTLGPRLAQHVRRGLVTGGAMLLYHADELRLNIEDYLLNRCRATRAEAVGQYRRRKETIDELSFVVEANDVEFLIVQLQRYGGKTPLISRRRRHGGVEAIFALPSGIELRIQTASERDWGFQVAFCSGSEAHLQDLIRAWGGIRPFAKARDMLSEEERVYAAAGLQFVPPELREGRDEVELAARHELPQLVTASEIRGELHAHTTASDGSYSIEEMAKAAQERGYEYLGISDHSQSLKIAGGVSIEDLRAQIREIDRLNARMNGFRILKSSEVDILSDGSLDYPDDVLCELDYTVCSIHSRFALGKQAQTERVLRAMDNRWFTILGHATGRLLLKRPGYELDMERVVQHARDRGCCFEINSSPDRLDLSAENARLARESGVKIAITTDAHSVRDYNYVRYGIGQARRAGYEARDVLNAQPLAELLKHLRT